MSEIKVGEYIRSVNGRLAKIKRIIHRDSDGTELYIDTIPYRLEDIKRHSNNLLDVIEKGDWVNGMRAYLFIYKDDPEEKRVGVICEGLGNEWIYAEDIKEILTHEAYNSNCFRIGEKNENTTN